MTVPHTYDPGDAVKVLAAFEDGNGAAYDPPIVRFHYRDSQGTLNTKVYGTDSVVTKLADGSYQLLIYIPYSRGSAGDWSHDVQALDGSGNSLSAQGGRFTVRLFDTLA